MERGVYSNGLPHPSPEMRLRIFTEVGVLVAMTTLFFLLAPKSLRNNTVYIGLALSALLMIMMKSAEIQEQIWGPPSSPEFDRVRRCFVNMFILTVPPWFLFLAYGLYCQDGRVWNANYLIALAFYIPWALLQQTLFQFYLLGRLRALLPFASPLTLAIINGIAYGLVHVPDSLVLAVVTMIGGVFWSYSYHRDRYVLPIALSHAILGSTFYYWVLNKDLIAAFFERLSGS